MFSQIFLCSGFMKALNGIYTLTLAVPIPDEEKKLS